MSIVSLLNRVVQTAVKKQSTQNPAECPKMVQSSFLGNEDASETLVHVPRVPLFLVKHY